MFVSAEVRWFWQDECPGKIRHWFDDVRPATGGGQLRVDKYLWQRSQPEISIKSSGKTAGFEIKGLVARLKSHWDVPVPCVELWCKWNVETSALTMTDQVVLRKVRRLRAYKVAKGEVVEIALGRDEKPLNGNTLSQQICNAEITEIEIAGDPRRWWTLGFEASSSIETAPPSYVLQRTAAFLVSRSFPFPKSCKFLSYPSWLAGLEPPITEEEPMAWRPGANLGAIDTKK